MLVSLVFWSCGNPVREVRIVTDRSELPLLLDLPGVVPAGVQVRVHYVDDVASLFRSGSPDADLVIARGLPNFVVMDQVLSLDTFVESGLIDLSQLMDSALELGRHRDSLRVLVLGFDIPLVYGNPAILPLGGDFQERYLPDLDSLRDLALQGNAVERRRQARLGFSPMVDPAFLTTLAMLEGASFTAGVQGEPVYNSVGITKALERASLWIDRSSGSVEAELLFIDTFAYLPFGNLLETRRLGLVHGMLSDYLAKSPAQRAPWSFVWLSKNGMVPVDPAVLGGAIPGSAGNPEDAAAILGALATTATQARYLERMVTWSDDSFGFLGAIPSNRHLYEYRFGQFYPDIAGRLPPEQTLLFPVSVPLGWLDWKKNILEPFLRSSIETGLGVDVLQSRTRQWLLQQGVAAQ